MSGIYGTVRPANITADDVDIYYSYSSTRNTNDANLGVFTKVSNPSEWLLTTTCDNKELPGLYNLRLPLDTFSDKGFYNIYIKPKEITATIQDVGPLATYSDIRGVVLSATGDLANLASANALVGYRIEYFDTSDSSQRLDITRLITSSNRCEGMTTTVSMEPKYRFTTVGSLIFCTVTPSLASSFKPNDAPYIGVAGQQIAISNTKFNPILLEVEMVDHDIETLTTAIEGEQVHDIDHGIITTFNEDREIYLQMDYKSVKDSLGNPAYTVKTKRNSYDKTQDIKNILSDIVDNT